MASSNITYGLNSTLYTTFTAPTVAGTPPGFLYATGNTLSCNFIFDVTSNAVNAIRSNIYTTPYSNTATSYFLTNRMHTILTSNSNGALQVVAQFLEARCNTTAPINYICTLSTQISTVPVGIARWTGY
jgi:hypothetical protein